MPAQVHGQQWSVTGHHQKPVLVQAVSEDTSAVGYSGIGYRTSGIKTVALARKAGEPYGTTEPGDVYSGAYPLARFLYVYINKPPNRELDPLVREFLRYVLSFQGQQVVVKDGYLPIPKQIASAEVAGLR